MVNRNISVRKNTDHLPHRPSVSFGGFCSPKRALHAYSFGVGPSVPPPKHKPRPMSTGTLEAFKCEPLSLLTVVLVPFFIAFFNFFLARLSTSHRNAWQQRTSMGGMEGFSVVETEGYFFNLPIAEILCGRLAFGLGMVYGINSAPHCVLVSSCVISDGDSAITSSTDCSALRWRREQLTETFMAYPGQNNASMPSKMRLHAVFLIWTSKRGHRETGGPGVQGEESVRLLFRIYR